MEHTIAAPRDGTVAELLYAVGDQVDEGGELLRLAAACMSPRVRGRRGASPRQQRGVSRHACHAHVTLVDVGPRDGLQNEKQTVDAARKIELVHRLQAAGLREIEVTSFVSPKWVPQMADNAAVLAGIERKPGVRYSVLIAEHEGPRGRAVGAARRVARRDRRLRARRPRRSASRTSTARSPRASSASRRSSPRRTRHGIKVRGAVSVALGCPYQGEVSADEVERVVRLIKEIGVDHCGIADTIGVGTPQARPGGAGARAQALSRSPR